jgi:hypothetical protein
MLATCWRYFGANSETAMPNEVEYASITAEAAFSDAKV